MDTKPGETSDAVRLRVESARERQRGRLRDTPWTCNGQMAGGFARKHARLAPEAEKLLATAVDSLALSGRGFDRMVKVARTIADLEGEETVGRLHVSEALGFRALWQAAEVA